jgi:outer membrane murein-binding lipoprotein Lpp
MKALLLIVSVVLLFALVGVAVSVTAGGKKDLASEVDNLKAQVAQLQKQAQSAQDYIAISNLQTAYGYYVDKAQWDQVADLFTKDGTLEIGLRGVWVGQDRVRAYLHKLPDLKYGSVFNHMQLQPMISVADDGQTAKARWRALIQVGTLGEKSQWGEGTYENEYVKEDGVWKIQKLHFYMTYYVDYYKGWDKGGDPAPGPIPGFPPDRPPTETYGLYPNVFIPPYHYANPVTGK